MEFPKSIKLVQPEDIRKLHYIPRTYDQLLKTITELFSSRKFEIFYSESCRVSSTEDLMNAYKWGASFPSLKLFLVEQERSSAPTCSLCGTQLFNSQYRCLECNMTLCELCEMDNRHPHLMLKGSSSKELDLFNSSSKCEKYFHNFYRFEKKLMKAKVVSHVLPKDFIAPPGQEISVGWVIQNSGQLEWPEGSALFWRSGELTSGNYFIKPIKPGETAEVFFKILTPLLQGEYSGTWEILVRGVSVIKLKAKILVAQQL